MSYILEALKKVEQKRVQEESPESLTLLGIPGSESKKRPFWPYPVLAALILNIGVMIWWIGPFRTEKKAPSPQPYAVQPTDLAPPILAGKTKPRPTGEKKERLRTKSAPPTRAEVPKVVQPVKPVPPILTGQNKSSQAVEKKEGLQEKGVPKTPAEVPKKEVQNVPLKVVGAPQTTVQPMAEPQSRLKKEAPPNGKILELSDLPSSLKSTLPEFKVSAHVYNPDRQNRMVRVNDKILQEGEELSPGLKVEEIVPGGIVFSYHGYRFRFRF
jgi:general secretion pathway protein B